MDNWRVAVLGDGGVGKTALAVQVCLSSLQAQFMCLIPPQFTLNCFVGKLASIINLVQGHLLPKLRFINLNRGILSPFLRH
jgi:GTPase SAR1 family protein